MKFSGFTSGSLTLVAAAVSSFAPHARAADWTWLTGDYLAQGLPNPLAAGETVVAKSGNGSLNNKVFVGAIVNNGTFRWQTSDDAFLYGRGTVLNNNGLFDLQADASVLSGGNFDETFNNTGILRKSGGSGVSAITTILTNQSSGVLDADMGTLAYRGGSYFATGSTFTGRGGHLFDNGYATYTFDKSFVGANNNLRFAAGTFASGGTDPVDAQTNLTWNGGTLAGNWHMGAAQTTTAEQGATKFLIGSLVNEGAVLWKTSDGVYLYGRGTVLHNKGLFDLQADAEIVLGGNFGETFDNTGILRKSGGTGVSAITAVLTNQSSGVLDADSGTLAYRGGSYFAAGSTFTGRGVHLFDNGYATYTFDKSFIGTKNNLQFAAGTFASGGVDPVDVRTNLTWNGGMLKGNWHVGATQTTTALSGGAKTLVGTLVNDGTVLWKTSNAVGLYGRGTVLRNNGLFDLQADAGITLGGNMGETFDNTGILRKSGGTGMSSITANLINHGAMEALSGTIGLYEGFRNEGIMRGTASYASVRIDNAGDISPGMPEGADRIATLRIDGSLVELSNGVLSFDVGAAGIGDLLSLTGSVAFDGTVNVTNVDGYRPQVGDRYRVVNFASFSGQLSDVIEHGFEAGVQFGAVYSADHLDLVVLAAQAVPEPATWMLSLCGLMALGAVAHRRSVAAR